MAKRIAPQQQNSPRKQKRLKTSCGAESTVSDDDEREKIYFSVAWRDNEQSHRNTLKHYVWHLGGGGDGELNTLSQSLCMRLQRFLLLSPSSPTLM